MSDEVKRNIDNAVAQHKPKITFTSNLDVIQNALTKWARQVTTKKIKFTYDDDGGPATAAGTNGVHAPTKNVTVTALALAKGFAGPINSALAKGNRQTLMGELGPELYVSNGRYHLVGRSGAEMVSLPSDAIVFNHIETRRLLKTGQAGHGKPVTNEKKATAMASGTTSAAELQAVAEDRQISSSTPSLWEAVKSGVANFANKVASTVQDYANQIAARQEAAIEKQEAAAKI